MDNLNYLNMTNTNKPTYLPLGSIQDLVGETIKHVFKDEYNTQLFIFVTENNKVGKVEVDIEDNDLFFRGMSQTDVMNICTLREKLTLGLVTEKEVIEAEERHNSQRAAQALARRRELYETLRAEFDPCLQKDLF